MDQRPIPDAALRDAEAVEMLRVWIAEKRLHCSLKVGMYAESTGIDEGAAWGTILADAARQIAAALQEGYGQNGRAVLRRIQDGINTELDKATSTADGGVSEFLCARRLKLHRFREACGTS